MAMYESELERHKRLHKNIKPFKCIFCDYNSSWKSDLKRHYEGHHKDRLGDEKSLNSIMNCYQNNAGTQMEVQNGASALDKSRLPVLLLSQTVTDQQPPRPAEDSKEVSKSSPIASPVAVEAAPKVEASTSEAPVPSPPALKLGCSPSNFPCKLCDFVGTSEWLLKQHALIQHQHNQTGAVHGAVSSNHVVSSSHVVASGVNGVVQPIPSEAKLPRPPPTLPALLPETYLKPPLVSVYNLRQGPQKPCQLS